MLLLLQRAYSVINGLKCAPAGLSMEEVREYERSMQEKTNCKVKSSQNAGEAANNLMFVFNVVNNTRNPEKSDYYVCPPPTTTTTTPILK